ncbi:valine--tRNA ligase, putative [Plasmodium gallinaceum]|uniref:valine--tRNA ligase n=1 Tax=Plasmodium gallinaceum TaxID=5849 RepID=A0A1J1GVM6_PLAGA|nr:valine--tRNA ligase, putative [Plasmodium gallinaceum]CRG95338.1 valine--tRNA ligase, putative [Plasmodium gallinaceum]
MKTLLTFFILFFCIIGNSKKVYKRLLFYKKFNFFIKKYYRYRKSKSNKKYINYISKHTDKNINIYNIKSRSDEKYKCYFSNILRISNIKKRINLYKLIKPFVLSKINIYNYYFKSIYIYIKSFLNVKNEENKRNIISQKHNKDRSFLINDILKIINKKKNELRNVFNYGFFKKDPILLNYELFIEILKRDAIKLNVHINHFTFIYNIDELDKIYNNLIVKYLYLFKKNKEKQYIEKFNTRNYYNSFILIYPPPNLSGKLHAGHFFNFIYQNIFFLFNKHILSKYSIPFFGSDHGGLSTHEMFSKIFKKTNLSREEYLVEIKKWQTNLKKNILESIQKMNIVVDENNFYNTIDEPMRNIVSKSFYILYKNNLIERKFYPVYYCKQLNTIIPYFDLIFKKEQKEIYQVKLYLIKKENINKPNENKDTGDYYGNYYDYKNNHNNFRKYNNDYIKESRCSENRKENIRLNFDKDNKNDDIKESKDSSKVKFFHKKIFHFEYLNEIEINSINKLHYINIELENIENLNRLIAILYFSKKEKYQNKYALLPLSNRTVPLIFHKKKNFYSSLYDNKDNEEEDLFIPVFSLKNENTNDFKNKEYTSTNRNYEKKTHTGNPEDKNSILLELKKNNLIKIIKQENSIVKYAYYKNYKCILTLSDQWNIKFHELNKLFSKSFNKDFTILPSKFKDCFFDNSLNNNEWFLSRQIHYGHHIPLFKYEKFETIEKDITSNRFSCFIYGNNIDEAYENLIKSNYFENDKIRKEYLKKEEDVLDSWFSSSLYFFYCLYKNKIDLYKLLEVKNYLVDFIYTGKDIMYPWIIRSFILLNYFIKNDYIKDILDYAKKNHNSMIDNSIKNNNNTNNTNSNIYNINDIRNGFNNDSKKYLQDKKVKYLEKSYLANIVKFHGILKDNIGKKISKSEENSTYYNKYIENTNIDSIRLSFSFLQKGTEDIIFSENFIHKSNKFIRKIWNIGNFIKKNCSFKLYIEMKCYLLNDNQRIHDFLKKKEIQKISDIGIFEKYCSTINSFMHEMKSHNMSTSINIIYTFVMNFFSKFYLNYYLYDNDNKKVKNFLIFHIFKGVLKTLYPFIPHITEILYTQLYLKYESHKHVPFKLLSCNYNFFENQNFILNENFEEKYFVAFEEIFNYLRNFKKRMSSNKIANIYLKEYQKKISINYFKNEENTLKKAFDINVSFHIFDKNMLNQHEEAYKKQSKQILYCNGYFVILE